MPGICSVVCVSYNHAQFAMAGLQSIYAQSYRNIEIIVLDDGSSDNSCEVIRCTLSLSPFKAKFIEQVNTGNVPENFNKAIGEASGEFLTMMSLDDILMPNCIENAITILVRSKNVIFAANTGHYEIDEAGRRLTPNIHLPRDLYQIKTAKDLLEVEYENLGVFYIQGQVFRLDALQAVNGFDANMTGDDIILRTKLFLYLAEHPNLTFYIGTETVFAYRKHSSNLHKNTFRQLKIIIEWKTKYFPCRGYPKLFYRWLDGFFREHVKRCLDNELSYALTYNEVIRNHFESYKKTWKYRRNFLKGRIAGRATQILINIWNKLTS